MHKIYHSIINLLYAYRVMRALGHLFAILIAIVLVSPIDAFSQQPTPPKLPYIEKVTIKDDALEAPCPFNTGIQPAKDAPKQETVVSTRVANPRPGLKYYYSVTGGQIVGEGPTVGWNFEGVNPGQYKITVSIGLYGVILGDVVSQTVTVREFSGCCLMPCECKNVAGITGLEKPAKTGDTIVFTAHTSGIVETTLKWTVEGGTIITTPDDETITVMVTAKPGGIVTALVELEGNREACNCVNSGAESVKIID